MGRLSYEDDAPRPLEPTWARRRFEALDEKFDSLGKKMEKYRPADLDLTFVPLLPVAVGVMVAILSFGPIDLMRDTYNLAVGDGVWQRQALVEYVREGVRERVQEAWVSVEIKKPLNQRRAYSPPPDREIEVSTMYRLHTKLGPDGRIDPAAIPMSRLWDASEEVAHSYWQQFVWPELK